MALGSFALVFISLAVLCLTSSNANTSPSCGVSLVLVGSNGDLAKRYLWPSVFHNFCRRNTVLQKGGCELLVYGSVTRRITNEIQLWLETTVNIDCPFASSDTSAADAQCWSCMDQFRQATQFVQLKFEEHYQSLSVRINEYYAQKGLKELGRIFYLAVPPSAYSEISKNIHSHAQPSDGWMRIVLEKPFGEDLVSAQLLADTLSGFFSEEEIYRVDHYLGKFGVQQILPFRELNSELLTPLWNSEQISHVEIAMKERLDVAGRSRFYDRYGVIRDVFQNHLTEILVQLTMDLPLNSSDKSSYLRAKSQLLSVVYPPHISQVILGQYMQYQQHLEQDGRPHNPGNTSRTPTYASVLVLLGSPKWRHVPFILTSGKQLGLTSAYAKVVLREKMFSLVPRKTRCPPEIIFLIQDEELQSPGILVSSHFSDTQFELPFRESYTWSVESVVFPPGGSLDCQYSFLHPEEHVTSNAYVSLLEALFDGKRDMFVDTHSLIRSWVLWTPVLKEIELVKPSVYLYNQTALDTLDFRLQNSKLVGNDPLVMLEQDTVRTVQSARTDPEMSALFQLPTYVLQDYELGSLLAEHVYSVAIQSTRERGAFHLALPGGSSPRPFLQSLVLNFQYLFPWQQTHIWQTDERCVKHNSPDSNLRQLSELLLSLSPILYPMVHPMPVEMVEGMCADDSSGTLLYERHLLEYANSGKLDYVLLGLGQDGHIASLFPEDAIFTTAGGPFVSMVTLKDTYPTSVKQRLTLGFKAILQARHIGLLIASEQKAEILNRVRHCLVAGTETCAALPVIKLLRGVTKEQATVYVDSQLPARG